MSQSVKIREWMGLRLLLLSTTRSGEDRVVGGDVSGPNCRSFILGDSNCKATGENGVSTVDGAGGNELPTPVASNESDEDKAVS